MFHQKFRVTPNKLTGWKRLVGQEVPKEGYSRLMTIAGASTYPAAASNIVDVNGAAVSAAPANASLTCRQVVAFVDGPQTPKATQPALDLFVPLTD